MSLAAEELEELRRTNNSLAIGYEARGKEIERLNTAIIALAKAGGAGVLCEGCPPIGYPTDKTRCEPCPRRASPVLLAKQEKAVTP